MSKSLSVTFRLPADMVEAFNSAVSASGSDKTAWLIDAITHKLGQPGRNQLSRSAIINHNQWVISDNLDARLLSLTERMETAAAALIGGKQGIPPGPYNEAAVIAVVVDTIRQGFDNGRIIAERINKAGYQTVAGRAWDKDIYSAWKRQGNRLSVITEALQNQAR